MIERKLLKAIVSILVGTLIGILLYLPFRSLRRPSKSNDKGRGVITEEDRECE